MKKKYYVEHTGAYGSITVEIDHGFVDKDGNDINAIIDTMLEFWIGSQKRIDENDGDKIKTFLKQLCEKTMRLVTSENLSMRGLLEEFEEAEGWCKMDGSKGIEIVDFEEPDFTTEYLYEVKEL